MSNIWTKLRENYHSGQQTLLTIAVDGPHQDQLALRDPDGHLLAGADLPLPTGVETDRLITCGDDLLYNERIIPPANMVIFGGGHIAVPLAAIAKITGFTVTVIDDRSDFANRERFPYADTVMALDYGVAAEKLNIGAGHYLVIVTRGHVHDRECMELALKTDAAYIGMIGSKKKVREVFDWARERGIDQEQLNRVFAPVGLPIGAQTPAEIAVSIIAEVINERSKQPPTADMNEILAALAAKGAETYALATIVEAGGATPRDAGSRMLVRPDGTIIGTVGGGLGEKLVIEAAAEVIQTNCPQLLDYNLNNTLAAGEGMICGGKFKIFVQPV
ncbi:MAG: xanthine dehydrogenase [Firmicutes bacterium]|nr:xanthine dehydrogenase [Bacillota bacterium]